jgi:hypothetical protein
LHTQHGFVAPDKPLLRHIHRDFDRRLACALADAALQHPQPPALHRELQVHHIAVVALQSLGDLQKLCVHFGHALVQCAQGQRRANSCDDILALRIRQELTVQLALARGRGRA